MTDPWLLTYRLSGWSQDIVWILIFWSAWKRKAYWTMYRRYFLLYISFITVFELVYALTAVLLENNLFLDYIYITVEFTLLGLFMGGIIRVRWLNILIRIAAGLFILFQSFNAFWGEGLENYNAYGALINNLFLTFLSVISLYRLFITNIGRPLYTDPIPWFVTGILLIFTSILLFDYLYAQAISYRSESVLYIIVISQNLLKTLFLFFFLRGVSIIRPL